MKEIETVIIAGGLGKRMGELTRENQKCQLEVDGKPILAHIFDNVITAFGSANITMGLGHKGEDIIKYFGNNYNSISIQYIHSPEAFEAKRRFLLVKDMIQSKVDPIVNTINGQS